VLSISQKGDVSCKPTGGTSNFTHGDVRKMLRRRRRRLRKKMKSRLHTSAPKKQKEKGLTLMRPGWIDITSVFSIRNFPGGSKVL